jgi:hypothetical protein
MEMIVHDKQETIQNEIAGFLHVSYGWELQAYLFPYKINKHGIAGYKVLYISYYNNGTTLPKRDLPS